MSTGKDNMNADANAQDAFGAPDIAAQATELARRVFDECRVSLTMAFRFLDRALWKMPFMPEGEPGLLATDGAALHFNPAETLVAFRANPNTVIRTYLHSLLHCIFRHPFHTVRGDTVLWSLACDICVEAVAVELCDGRFALEHDVAVEQVAAKLAERDIPLTPAGVYRALLMWSTRPSGDAQLTALAAGMDLAAYPFVRDDHRLWDLEKQPEQNEGGDGDPQEGDESAPDDSDKSGKPDNPDADEGMTDDADPDEDNKPGGQGGETADSDEHEDDEQGQEGNDTPSDGDEEQPGDTQRQGAGDRDDMESMFDEFENEQERDDSDGRGNSSDADGGTQAGGAAALDRTPPEYKEGEDVEAVPVADTADEDEWQAIAQQVEAALQTLDQQRGDGAGRMLGNLALANRSRIDYEDFMRRFATREEDMKLNDEEFDYLFYTYGLARYGNMPLIEPLEYKEDEVVREFVIAIDTSGSCSHGLVNLFLTRTYEILDQVHSSRDRTNIHIVQCDATVQSDTVITCKADLLAFEHDFTARGWGGTDFRPVFAYVDELVERREFENLRGLVYFTDGFGVFPDHAPGYDVAFVFVEDEGRQRRVPPWAMKVVMSTDEIEELF